MDGGVWFVQSCVRGVAKVAPGWLVDAQQAKLEWYFMYRRFTVDGKRIWWYAFGAEQNSKNFFVPCVDLQQEGALWVGRVDRDKAFSRGSGELAMGKMLDDLDKLWGGGVSPKELKCTLTRSSGNVPSLITWDLGPADGPPVYRIEFAPKPKVVTPTKGTSAARPKTCKRTGFAQLIEFGNWALADPVAEQEHPWLRVARQSGLSFCFLYRQYTINGMRQSVYGFGAKGDRANFAVPCIQVVGRYKVWTAESTGDEAYHRGRGEAVISGFWTDFGRRAGQPKARPPEMRCKLTLDDAEDARSLSWEVVRVSDGQSFMNVTMTRQGAPADGGGVPSRQSESRQALAARLAGGDDEAVEAPVAVEWPAPETAAADNCGEGEADLLADDLGRLDELKTEEILAPEMFAFAPDLSGIKGFSVAEIGATRSQDVGVSRSQLAPL